STPAWGRSSTRTASAGSPRSASRAGGPAHVEAAPAVGAVGPAGDVVGRGEDLLHGLLLREPLGQEEGDGAGDVGRGHGGAGQVAVGVLLPLAPEGGVDVVGLRPVVAAAGGQDRPLGVARGAGVVRQLAVVAGGADDEGVHVAVLRAADAGAEEVVVA